MNMLSSDRSFGFVLAIFSSIIFFVRILRYGDRHPWPLILAAFFLVTSIVFPRKLSALKKIWLKFSEIINQFTQPVVMAVLFFLIFTPIGLIRRLIGNDPLRKVLDKDASTYWMSVDDGDDDSNNMKYQF